MRDKIIKIIQLTFQLDDDSNIQAAASMPGASSFPAFTALLSILDNQDSSPHDLAQALEQVVVQIKLKAEQQTVKERLFITLVHDMLYKPQYTTYSP